MTMTWKGRLADYCLSFIPARFAQRLMTVLARRFLRARARFFEPSMILSVSDDARCSEWLMAISIEAIAHAARNDLAALSQKHAGKRGSEFYDLFPGDHYRLLNALTATLRPTNIVEIGTYTGMSAVCFLHSMQHGAKLTTFDLVAWHQFPTHLDRTSFESSAITQHLADLSQPEVFDRYRELFATADLIFCDGPKDGVFERKLLENLVPLAKKEKRLLVFDDVRQLNMIDIWHSIASPKLDLVSFGHVTGTGLVDLSQGVRLKSASLS